MRNVNFRIGAGNATCKGYLHDDLSAVADSYRLRPCVIVLPGGAYQHLSLRETDPAVLPLLASGYQVFVLSYSLSKEIAVSAPEEELALSVRRIKESAEEWDVDRDRIALLGFSAGGHLAASLAVHWRRYGELSRPDSAVLCYPVITTGAYTHKATADNVTQGRKELYGYYSLETQVTDETIPCFLWHTAEDEAVDVRNSLMFYSALLEHKVPSELHIYGKGPHGSALGHAETGPELKSIQSWYSLAENWLNERWGYCL